MPDTIVRSQVGPAARQVDVRDPRFAAWVATAVLIAVLLPAVFSAPAAAALLVVPAAVFAAGALLPRSTSEAPIPH